MKYTVRGNEIVQIGESEGVIQNIGNCEIELSDTSTFENRYILSEYRHVAFNKRLFIRPRDEIPTPHSIQVNVVSFVVL